MNLSDFSLLTFDCYGTMIDWESGIFSALRPILAAHQKTMTDVALLEMYSELQLAAEEQQYMNYWHVLESVVGSFGRRLGFTPSQAEVRSLPESVRTWQPFPDTVAALQKLKSRHRLAVISNIDDDLFALTAAKLEVPFNHVITAQQAGCYKPCSRIFRLAQERTGVAPAKWLHVGQSIYHDVIPAKSMGVATVWVNRPSPRAGAGATRVAIAKPDLEVSSLAEVCALAEN
ncbi:MAG: haloacid dehalogenase type II [Terriglobales bacterium]